MKKNVLTLLTVCLLFNQSFAQEIDQLRLSYNQDFSTSTQSSVTVSNDGKLIAFAYDNKTIKVLSTINGRVIKKINGVHDKFFELRFNKDATKLISVGEKDNVAIINVKTGAVEKQFELPNKVTRVAVSRANDYIAFGTMDAHVYVYDMNTAEQKCHIDRVKHHVSGLDFDPRGGKIAVAVMSSLRQSNPVTIHDVESGSQLEEIEKRIYSSVEYNKDGSKLFLSGLKGTSTFVSEYNTDNKTLKMLYKKNNMVSVSLYPSIALYENTILAVSIDKAFEVIDSSSGDKLYTTKRESTKLGQMFAKMGIDIKRIYPLYDGETYLINYSNNNINQLYNANDRRISAFIYSDSNDDLVIASRDGRMDGTAEAMSGIFWSERKSNKAIPLEATFDQFYTPGLLPELLSGVKTEIVSEDKLIQAIELAPICSITVPDSISTVTSSNVTLQLTATPNGDPIDNILLFVNGKKLGTETRGFVKTSQTQTIDLSVLPGQNVITAVAVSEGGYQSSPDQVIVNYKGQTSQANLYMVAIGINDYKNSSYNLNYAIADAQAFADEIQQKSASIFKNIDLHFIKNSDATKTNIQQVLTDIKTRIQQQDVFIFYYAGHGVLSEGSEEVAEDFFLALYDVTQMYGNDDLLSEKGVSAAELRNYFSEVPAQKQLIVLDACQSGGAVETFARRGAAEEKAMIQLARSAGVVLMASTGSEQFATEFAQLGHGVFTYALLQGISGNADGGSYDKKITVKELESYMNDAVPELTEKYKGTMQFPRSWARGQDFPLVIVNE